MSSVASQSRGRLLSTLSEDETYGRLVEHGASELSAQATSPRPNLGECGRQPLSSISSPSTTSVATGRSRLCSSDSLWMEVLDVANFPDSKKTGEQTSSIPYNGRSSSSPEPSGRSCIPLRSFPLNRSASPPLTLPLGSPSLGLRQYDDSPGGAKSRSRVIESLAASPAEAYARAKTGPDSDTAGGLRGRPAPGAPPKKRRMSSILDSFTCDLVATDIEYEVPIPQPGVLGRAKGRLLEEAEQPWNWNRCLSCCSRKGDYEFSSETSSSSSQPPLNDVEADGATRRQSISGDDGGGGEWRKILHKISIEALPGKMIAILGGSGSGKTSLLDVLSGRSPPACRVSGKITINDAEVGRSSEELKFCVGYVPQSIFLLPNLTVRETLQFVALLRLPKSLTHLEKLIRVGQVMTFLGLESLADRKVGGEEVKGLSGGQQRLVAIGTQMIYNPGVLILDEPTSGLDSYTAEHVCKTLHELAMKRSRAILLTIHQPGPEITRLFDHVVIMSNGHTVYNGPADMLVRYFNCLGYTLPEFTNPCDYYVDLATLDTRSTVREQHSRSCFDFLVNAYRDFKQDLWQMDEESESDSGNEDLDEQNGAAGVDGSSGLNRWTPAMTPMHPSHGKMTSFASRHLIDQRRQQFVSLDNMPKPAPTPPESVNAVIKCGILLRRTVRNELLDIHELMTQAFQAALLSILFGLVFIQLGDSTADLRNRKAALFIAFTLYQFMAVFDAIAKYAGQQMMVFHEMVNGLYTTTPFGAAKILGELPGSLFLTVIYTIPLYFMASLRLEAVAYFKYLLISILLMQVSRMMALAASVITQSPNYAALSANLLFTGWILTAGYIININDLWAGVWWIAFISPVRYAFQGAVVTELGGRNFSDCTAAGAGANTSYVSNTTTTTTAPTCTTLLGDNDLRDLGFDKLSFNNCAAILAGMYCAMVATVLIAMHVRRNSRPE